MSEYHENVKSSLFTYQSINKSFDSLLQVIVLKIFNHIIRSYGVWKGPSLVKGVGTHEICERVI